MSAAPTCDPEPHLPNRRRFLSVHIVVSHYQRGASFFDNIYRRFAFWINLPLTGIAIVLTVWLLPLRGVTGNLRDKLLKIDYLGSILTVVGSILILVSLSTSGATIAAC